MRVVVALGGNALLQRSERPDADIEQRHITAAARSLAPLARDHDVLLCHGNGPQIGLLALESGDDAQLARPYPLDALGAQTQGMIGYWLARELTNAGVTRPVAVVITQTEVDPRDQAFSAPTKFVGAGYDKTTARDLAGQRGWNVALDGHAWRRVVPSPEPHSLIEIATIITLFEQGTLVICGGGGGVPVIATPDGWQGVEAVVDKDLTAAMLAIKSDADRLLLLTDVDAVKTNFGRADESRIARITTSDLASMRFAEGSMGPKIQACIRFANTTGRAASIGSLAEAEDVLSGAAGTTIVPAAPTQTP